MGRHPKYTEDELIAFAEEVVGYLRDNKMYQRALNDVGAWPCWSELEDRFGFHMGERAPIRRIAEKMGHPLIIDAGGVRLALTDEIKALAVKRRLKDNGTRAKNLGKEVNSKGREELRKLVLELDKTKEGDLLMRTLPKLLAAFDQTAELAEQIRMLLPPNEAKHDTQTQS